MRNADYPLTLLYDGECPLCRVEIARLARRDGLKRLVMVDITEPGFDASRYGATLDAMRRLIHAVRPDGSLVVGVDVFRLSYGAVGLAPLVAPLTAPGLRPLFERAYAAFARNRYGISSLFAPLLIRMEAAGATRRTAGACEAGVCKPNQERSVS